MTKTAHSGARLKAQTTLDDVRYASPTTAKSMNNYEKMLLRQQQAAKAAAVRSMRKKMGPQAGALSSLFATIH